MQRINEDIKTGNFKQIYLLYGEERYLKNQYTTRLRKALCQDGDEMNTCLLYTSPSPRDA